jgi:adenylate cyclase
MVNIKKRAAGRFRIWVLVFPIVLVAGLLYYVYHRTNSPSGLSANEKSIAVLPFVNMTGDSTNDYFCNGITDAIIGNLNNISDLKVSPRASVLTAFKINKKDILLTGSALHVGSVLAGSIQQKGSKLNMKFKLVEIPSGKTIWIKDYNREIRDIFSVQSELAQLVAVTLHSGLTQEEREQLDKRPTRNLEAYDQYMQGRYYYGFRKDSTLRMAIKYFNQAIKLDSSYSKAYSGLADSYAALGYISYELPSSAFLKSEAAALKALELDSTLADPHTSLGYVKFYYYWDWEGAEVEFRKAQEMNPRYAPAYDSYAYLLTARERFPEAKMAMDKALQLDPLSQQINTDKGFSLFYMREYDQAMMVLKNSLTIEPRNPLAHVWLGRVYQEKKMYKEAIAEYEKTLAGIKDWPVALAAIGYVYGIMGQKTEAEKMLIRLQEVSASRYVTPYGVALIYASINDRDKTFERLDKAFEEKSNWLVWLKQDPRWGVVSDDPRYLNLIAKIGLLKKNPPVKSP